jgi:two-component system sensor histidine kinase CreC
MMELTALERRRTLGPTEPVVLRALLQDLATSAESAGAPRHLRVQLHEGSDVSVDGDPLLLRRAVGNLLDNALDFSPDGGTIEITLTRKGSRVDVGIRDHGPGMPDFADAKVFEKFFSLARPHNRRKSTGLGLAFVKEIAELHHGRVTLRNAEGGGALATLNLPCVDAPR